MANNKSCKQCNHYHCSVFKDDYGTFLDTWCKKYPEKDLLTVVSACEDFEIKRGAREAS